MFFSRLFINIELKNLTKLRSWPNGGGRKKIKA
jgi:hypothetical protein